MHHSWLQCDYSILNAPKIHLRIKRLRLPSRWLCNSLKLFCSLFCRLCCRLLKQCGFSFRRLRVGRWLLHLTDVNLRLLIIAQFDLLLLDIFVGRRWVVVVCEAVEQSVSKWSTALAARAFTDQISHFVQVLQSRPWAASLQCACSWRCTLWSVERKGWVRIREWAWEILVLSSFEKLSERETLWRESDWESCSFNLNIHLSDVRETNEDSLDKGSFG